MAGEQSPAEGRAVNKQEFAGITAGITAARVAELTGKSVTQIQSYLSGRANIPFEVAQFAVNLKNALEKIKLEKNAMNSREMKAVIDGKLYNTQTATMLSAYSNGLGDRDFTHLSEELYRTKNGSYFLAGDGGPQTKYAESCGNNSVCGGEKITPLTEQEAREWMEAHADADDYVAAFGEPPEA